MQLKTVILSSILILAGTVAATPVPMINSETGEPPKTDTSTTGAGNGDTTTTANTNANPQPEEPKPEKPDPFAAGSRPRPKFTNSKAGINTDWTCPTAINKMLFPGVMRAFEDFAIEEQKPKWVFLCSGGAWRLDRGISQTTGDIDVWSKEESWMKDANLLGVKFKPQLPKLAGVQLGMDWFNHPLKTGMDYFDTDKLWAKFVEGDGADPLYISQKEQIKLYSLPIEWQIQTKLMRLSMWYGNTDPTVYFYAKELKNIMELLWYKTEEGKVSSDLLNAANWLKEYQSPTKPVTYAAGLLKSVEQSFVGYVANGGKFGP